MAEDYDNPGISLVEARRRAELIERAKRKAQDEQLEASVREGYRQEAERERAEAALDQKEAERKTRIEKDGLRGAFEGRLAEDAETRRQEETRRRLEQAKKAREAFNARSRDGRSR